MLQRLLLFSAVLLSATGTTFAQQSLHEFLGMATKNIIIIQDFDDPESGIPNITWDVKGSMYITKTDDKPYPEKGLVNTYPSTLGIDLIKENEESMRAFVVRAAFNKKGYNYLEFVPTQNTEEPIETDKEGNRLPGIYFNDPILGLGLFVWGNHRDYSLEAEFETPAGTNFTISLGSLNFQGWRVLRAQIPIKYYRENTTNSIRGTKYTIKLNKLTLWTKPGEAVDDFVVYFDSMFATKALRRKIYDGYKLVSPEVLNSIEWEAGASENGSSGNNNQNGENENQTNEGNEQNNGGQ